MKSAFEAMGGTDRQCGDYPIPEIALPDTETTPIGKYGRMRHRYLKEHRKVLYNAMVLDGTLWNHFGQHRTMGTVGFDGSFAPIAQYEKREIHPVFPYFPYVRSGQNTGRISLPQYAVFLCRSR